MDPRPPIPWGWPAVGQGCPDQAGSHRALLAVSHGGTRKTPLLVQGSNAEACHASETWMSRSMEWEIKHPDLRCAQLYMSHMRRALPAEKQREEPWSPGRSKHQPPTGPPTDARLSKLPQRKEPSRQGSAHREKRQNTAPCQE